MKVKNLILPLLAFIFAIGTFAAVHHKAEPKTPAQGYDYILDNGSWEPIPEQDCGQGGSTCQVRLQPGGDPYPVYDEMNASTLKSGDGTVKDLF